MKWDGIWALAAVEAAGWRLWGRRRADYTGRHLELEVPRRLPARTLVDAELVPFDADARPDLPRLLRRHGLTDPWRIRQARHWCPVRYVVFDSFYHGGAVAKCGSRWHGGAKCWLSCVTGSMRRTCSSRQE